MSRLSSCWFPARIAPPAPRNSSGSTKLKNAALGLRQNMRRSRRYWRQPSCTASSICGQLQVDVLERRAPDGQLLELATFRQRGRRELGEQGRRVVGFLLDELA